MSNKKLGITGAIAAFFLVLALAVGYGFSGSGNAPMQSAADTQNAKDRVTIQWLDINQDWCNAQTSALYPLQPYASKDNKVYSTLVDVTDGKNNLLYKTPVFDVGAMHPLGDGYPSKLWSDAVNYPLATHSLLGVETVMCHDPLQAATVINRLAAQQIDGTTIAALNPWIHTEGLDGDLKNASNWAQHCWSNDLTVHQDCYRVMASAVQMLEAFKDEGVQKTTSAWQVDCLAYCLAVNDTVPTLQVVTDKAKQDAGYFVVITLTSKTSPACFLRLGFNVGIDTENGGDQRMVGLPCSNSSPSPSASVPTQTPKTPGPGPSSTPSKTTGTTPPPSGTPSSTPPSASPTPSHSTSVSPSASPSPSLTTSPPASPTPSPSVTTKSPTPSPTPSKTSKSPTPKPSETTSPPKTCDSVYGPGYSGEYPNCHKDGGASVQPTQPTNAPGKNPTPDPTKDSGSNQCYDDHTGQPVTCP